MEISTTSLYATRAVRRLADGERLTGNEQRRVASLVRVNYRPLGAAPAQLIDRIHSVQDPYLGALSAGIPSGYVEKSATYCNGDGTTTAGKILFKPS